MKITVKKPNLNVDTYRLKLVVAMLTNPTLGPACSATVRKAIETCSAPSGLDEKLEPLTELYSLAQQDSESALELIEAAEKIRAENVLRDADSIENGEIPPAMRLHAALLERATQFKRRLHNVIKLGEHELGRKRKTNGALPCQSAWLTLKGSIARRSLKSLKKSSMSTIKRRLSSSSPRLARPNATD